MPIYEYYCLQNHTIYQFFAKTLAQGKTLPRCPDNPKWTLQKTVSQFAFTGRAVEPSAAAPGRGPAHWEELRSPAAQLHLGRSGRLDTRPQ
jgi:hypothetical protein